MYINGLRVQKEKKNMTFPDIKKKENVRVWKIKKYLRTCTKNKLKKMYVYGK